ncbi:MAG: 2-isopropylmalate synthase [Candidatus Micrarchaeota archaeon]|nr:2-isopropylmalate synthase [Candidatus Micrarchaeota archaeon]MDE1804474.1 2-isopropylmalate synthase [Candidatus Micrarchaeota archaeon]MDE1846637.1 2-isopropylmalate synthase [Candidatus Micrarchaeota archaeon]
MKVRIFDTTLRDGEQTPGVALRPEQKLAIAKKLDELGVDAIEAGFPVITQGEMEGVKIIGREGLRAEICGLARAEKKDIDAVADAGLSYVHTFIATSDIHLKYKLNMTRDEALARAVEAVEYAKGRGLQVEFSAEDATRTERSFLTKVFRAVKSAGADRLDIPDTVGYSTPSYIAQITREAVVATGLPVSVHCHNDFGLAVANAISGIQAGAQCAHVTVNGIGERAGNASIEELVMALQKLDFGGTKYETNINTRLFYATSKFVSGIVGINVQPNKAIVGENAFRHESGIHTHGVLNNPLTYEPIGPEEVGQHTSIEAGKHAGMHGIAAMLEEYGIKPGKDQMRSILDRVKEAGDRGRRISEVELLSFAGEVMRLENLKRFVHLTGFSVSTGVGNMPYAFVKLDVDGKELIGTDYGVGPVDASLKAIQKATGSVEQMLIRDYKLDSISGGSDALCEVTIDIEDCAGTGASAKAVGEDIVITSVQAMIEGMNRLMLKKSLKRNV